jgi:protein-disulfide isomerase
MIPRSPDMTIDALNRYLCGNPTRGPIKVVQYGDFECRDCGKSALTLSSYRQRFRSYIEFTYRHFPLATHHLHSMQAAEAAECARAQGRFWAMHDILFANQERLELRHLYDYAGQVGLDIPRFTTEMEEEVHVPTIRQHIRSGNAALVQGTPAFLVDGTLLDRSGGLRGLFESTQNAIDSRIL